jgi:hypothetical protein
MAQPSPATDGNINPYQPPSAALGADAPAAYTEQVAPKGWSWAAFLWGWVWAIGNSTWIGLLCLVPYAGIIMNIVLGVKGKEWAWKNGNWRSVDHFNEVQRKWVKAWFIVMAVMIVITVLFVVAST